jgi:Peptidase_C39 like family
MAERKNKPESSVTEEEAKKHALFSVRSNWVMGFRGFEDLTQVGLGETPIIIHDLNGQELFYEYSVLEGDREVGLVKASASRQIGSAVPQIQITPRRWNPDIAKNKTREMMKKRYPKAKIFETDLVCYSYPKIGVRYLVDDPEIGEGSVIFDAGSLAQVELFGSDQPEGFTSWSFYQEIPEAERGARERRWEHLAKALEVAESEIPAMLGTTLKARELKDLKKSYISFFQKKSGMLIKPVEPAAPIEPIEPIKPYTEKIIKFGPHCTTHNCYRLSAQQTNVYCAVATGQMILDFYRYYYTQEQIATAMGTTSGGSTNEGQANAYVSLSNKCLTATIDTTADWSEARAEIDANRPLKSGISGHARACFGYKSARFWIVNQPQPRWLYILDPWPWNANICTGGAEYWEDWYAITHTNFIYVRHRTNPCT